MLKRNSIILFTNSLIIVLHAEGGKMSVEHGIRQLYANYHFNNSEFLAIPSK